MLRQSAGTGGHGAPATAYRSRRAHTKTRTGCRTCRQRKVKCDETRPICTNCSKRGLHSECEYRDTVVWVHQTNHHPASSSTSTSSPGTPCSSSSHHSASRSDGSAPGGTPEFSPRDIEMSDIDTNVLPAHTSPHIPTSSFPSTPPITSAPLPATHSYTHTSTPTSFPPLGPTHLSTLRLLHLFTTTTALSLSTRPAVHRVWQTHIPTLALRLADCQDQAYLLHAVLAVAGLHAARLSFGGKRKRKQSIEWKRKMEIEGQQWLVIASEENQKCLEGFRAAVARYANKGVGNISSDDALWNEVGAGQSHENIGSHGGEAESVASIKYRGPSTREDAELEAVFMASGLLCIYGCSTSSMRIEQEIEAKNKHTSTNFNHGTMPTTTTTLPAPLLSWLPLMRGTPAMIDLFSVGWVIFSRGRLAALSTGLDSTVPKHPYTEILSSLSLLLTPEYNLHPGVRQPQSPLTHDVFAKVMDVMKYSFERFFAFEDPVAATMSFPATVKHEFVVGVLGIAGSGVGVGGNRNEWSGGTDHDGLVMDRDPRSLVIMAHFMVLMVMIEYLLPGEQDVGGLAEGEWRGTWDDSESEDDEDESVGNDHGRGMGLNTRHTNAYPPRSTRSEVRPSASRGWWIAGLGKREIADIARYLAELDAEEARVSGSLGVEGGQGRWMGWMKWPLEMIEGDCAARAAHDYVPQDIVIVKRGVVNPWVGTICVS